MKFKDLLNESKIKEFRNNILPKYIDKDLTEYVKDKKVMKKILDRFKHIGDPIKTQKDVKRIASRTEKPIGNLKEVIVYILYDMGIIK
jgi:hypothetical protein